MTSIPRPPSHRSGLIAAGNFIVDTIVDIDHYPAEEMLANVLGEARANGGGPYNVLCDLAALNAPFPLAAIGLVGDDENGRWVQVDCKRRGIDATGLQMIPEAATSYTHVMTARATGRRTFFHRRGANSRLDTSHFDFSRSTARLFHLGYLMLLDRLDAFVEPGRSGATLVLEAATAAGLETSVDLVSVNHPDFSRVVASALPWTDHLIMNEVEAGQLLGERVGDSNRAELEDAAQQALGMGVRRSVVIHTVHGSVAASRTDGVEAIGSLALPAGYCRGSNGAGDAFAAGYLYGVHEGWPLSRRLRLGTCAAAACLSDPSPSAGLRPLQDCMELERRFPNRGWSRSPAGAGSVAR